MYIDLSADFAADAGIEFDDGAIAGSVVAVEVVVGPVVEPVVGPVAEPVAEPVAGPVAEPVVVWLLLPPVRLQWLMPSFCVPF